MRSRTKEFAWAGVLFWGFMFAGTTALPAIKKIAAGSSFQRVDPVVYLQGVLCAVLIVGWAMLLARKTWAWWLLVALHTLFAVAAVALLVQSGQSRSPAVAEGIIAALLSAPVLWILVRDRPSAWTRSGAGEETRG